MTYHPVRDFAPVANLFRSIKVLWIHPGLPATTADDWLRYVRGRPGALNFASGGVGSSNHVDMELVRTAMGLDRVHVPYNGPAAAIAAVATGDAQAMIVSVGTGLPLARIQNERVYQRNVFDLVAPNMFAGSVLDLEPDTQYEVRFVLSDPDGIAGPAPNATKTATVRTRPEPGPAEGGKVYHVYPTKWKGPKIEPAFEGIMCAYNYYCGGGDTAPGGRPRVKPGDVILVHAGTYAYHWEFYGNQTTVNATTVP